MSIRIFNITDQHDGQRIDNFLIRHLKGVPKSHLYRLLSSGQIRVNKKRIKPDYRLKTLDLIRVPPIRISETKEKEIPSIFFEQLKDSFLYEDENLMIINKPSGMAVHAGSGEEVGLIEVLRKWRELTYLELAHRIDKETSGCVIVTKNRKTLSEIHQLFRKHEIKKTYRAILKGKVSFEKIEMKTSIEEKEAETLFVCLKTGKNLSFVEAFPKSGRTHQIRIHAAELNHPILGDKKYGGGEANRLYLHAYQLQFNLFGEELIVTAPLPSDFEKC